MVDSEMLAFVPRLTSIPASPAITVDSPVG